MICRLWLSVWYNMLKTGQETKVGTSKMLLMMVARKGNSSMLALALTIEFMCCKTVGSGGLVCSGPARAPPGLFVEIH